MGRKHYTSEEKLAAVKLYIQYDFSPSAVIYQLGYLSRNRLYGFCFVSSSILSIYELPFITTGKGHHSAAFAPDRLSGIRIRKRNTGFAAECFIFRLRASAIPRFPQIPSE